MNTPIDLQSGHQRLLSWAMEAVVPDAPEPTREGILKLVAGWRQHPSLRSHVCGLELHHDEGERLDVQVLCKSRFTSLGGLELPTWWPALMNAADPLPVGQIMGQIVDAGDDELKRSRQSSDVASLSGLHWLEFDVSTGSIPKLAGIFQEVNCHQPRSLEAWNGLLSRLDSIGCCQPAELSASTCLLHLFQSFGIPWYWGFMVGRAGQLKVVNSLGDHSSRHLESFLQEGGWADRLNLPSPAIGRLSQLLAEPPEDLSVRLNLDWRGSEDLWEPSLGVELAPLPGKPATNRMMESLASFCTMLDVSSRAVDQMRRTLSRLPTGIKDAQLLESGGIAQSDTLVNHYKIAILSHIKVTLSNAKPPLLKSYVLIRMSQKDENHSTSLHAWSASC